MFKQSMVPIDLTHVDKLGKALGAAVVRGTVTAIRMLP